MLYDVSEDKGLEGTQKLWLRSNVRLKTETDQPISVQPTQSKTFESELIPVIIRITEPINWEILVFLSLKKFGAEI